MINIKPENHNLKVLLATRSHLFYALAAGLCGIAILVLGVFPQIKSSIQLISESKNQQPRLDRLRQKLAELENIQFTPEFSKAAIVNSAMPSKKPLLELLTSLQSISSSNGITIKDFKLNPGDIATQSAKTTPAQSTDSQSPPAATPATPTTTAPTPAPALVDTLEVELEISGTAESVNRFLIQLEQITPFTTITQFSVSKEDEFSSSPGLISLTSKNKSNKLKAKITTQTYFYTQSISATLESPLPELSSQDRLVIEELSSFVAHDLPEQTEVKDGGLEDLFGVDPLLFE